MKALSKELKSQHSDWCKSLAAARNEVENAVETFNNMLEEAEGFCQEEVAGAIQDYMDERSEKWLESEAAQEVDSWKAEWEGVYLTRLEVEFEGDDEFANLPLVRG